VEDKSIMKSLLRENNSGVSIRVSSVCIELFVIVISEAEYPLAKIKVYNENRNLEESLTYNVSPHDCSDDFV